MLKKGGRGNSTGRQFGLSKMPRAEGSAASEERAFAEHGCLNNLLQINIENRHGKEEGAL